MRLGDDLHLTYCTNIHSGETWEEVYASIRQYGPALKHRISPGQPFGIGLRLSQAAAAALLEGDRLAAFQAELACEALYVYTLNGFPYGSFHRTAVKDLVHAPDWRTAERADYTIQLARILARLLPDNVTEGSISTSPLSYKPWLAEGGDDGTVWQACVERLVQVAQVLVEIERDAGKWLHVDLEPEPDGLLETAAEVCSFFRDHLLCAGAARLAVLTGFSEDAARVALLRHIGVCLDTCHMAIEYETPAAFVGQLSELGIRVGKVQISSALRVPVAGVEGADGLALAALPTALAPYAESTYLHQVIQRNRDGSLTRYRDLPAALAGLKTGGGKVPLEWRVHFHVPVFTASCGAFGTTQQDILDTLALLASHRFSSHLEIETYTWEVLPVHLKQDLVDSLVREFAWTRAVIPAQLDTREGRL